MELAMTSPLTMHQLGVSPEPKGLTSHQRKARLRTASLTTVKASTRPKAALVQAPAKPRAVNETIPARDTLIDLSLDYVVFEDEQGKPKTPMTKLRFDSATRKWVQVGANFAGLLAFFDEPPKDESKQMRVVRVIPSGRAVYVVPV